MLEFLRKLWNGLFKNKVDADTLPTPTYYVPENPPAELPEREEVKQNVVESPVSLPVGKTHYTQSLEDKLTAFFLHTKKRMDERYNGFFLIREQYDKWDSQLQKGELKYCVVDGEIVYYVEYGREVFFFKTKDGHIVTAIPPRKKYIEGSVGFRDEFNEFFVCTRTKIREYYGFELSRELYDKWDMMLRVGALKRCTTEREVYFIHHNQHVVFLAEKKGHIVTALAPRNEFLRNSIGRTGMKHHTGKVKAKNAGRRN